MSFERGAPGFRSDAVVFRRMTQLAVLLCSLAGTVQAVAAEGYWQSVALQIGDELRQVVQVYLTGDATEAKRGVTRAYFGVFEGKKMEAAMRMEQGAKHTYLVERQFGGLRKAIKRGESAEQLGERVDALVQQLNVDAAALDEAGIPPEVFKTGR